jgi:hypothetical protein
MHAGGVMKTLRIMHGPRFDHRKPVMKALTGIVLLVLPALASAQVFWSVTDEAGRQNWLLGTVHAEDPRLLEWPAPLVDALGNADRLAVELVPDAAALSRLRSLMRFERPRLAGMLESELFDRVATILEQDYDIARPELERMRPWSVAMTLATPPPETGLFMDLMLVNRARGAGLEVRALETVDEQLAFMTSLTREQQITLIRKAVADYDGMEASFEKLLSAYFDGDLERLQAIAAEEMVGLDTALVEHFDRAGLVERNRRMLERALPWLEDGGLIIAVGALHLPGEEGLIALLRERGYRVTGIY